MYYQLLNVLALGCALAAGEATDLAGFQITIKPTLIILYGQAIAAQGTVLDQATTAQEPTLALPEAPTAQTLAVLLVDLDASAATQPTTFLHWLQTDLVADTASSVLAANQNSNNHNTPLAGFKLANAHNTPALAAYTAPDPPHGRSSHRLALLVLDTSALPAAGRAALQTGAGARRGFDAAAVLRRAGLGDDAVVAWNVFDMAAILPQQGAAAAPAVAEEVDEAGAKGATATGGAARATPSGKHRGHHKGGEHGGSDTSSAKAAKATGTHHGHHKAGKHGGSETSSAKTAKATGKHHGHHKGGKHRETDTSSAHAAKATGKHRGHGKGGKHRATDTSSASAAKATGKHHGHHKGGKHGAAATTSAEPPTATGGGNGAKSGPSATIATPAQGTSRASVSGTGPTKPTQRVAAGSSSAPGGSSVSVQFLLLGVLGAVIAVR